MMEKIASFFNINMLIAVLLYICGHVLAWYTHNLQFAYDWWKDKPVLSNIVFGVPCGFAFWYGTRYAMEAYPELWTARFVAFAISYVTFPILTWYYLSESMFTAKTLICTFLAFLIITVQIVMK